VKKRELLRKIGKAAKAHDLEWAVVREGANHEIWVCGKTQVSIPRHDREIGKGLADDICQDLQDELGMGWWR
jgi:hypothetical protein